MTSKVLGISASPFPDGNVERMITYMINRSTHDGQMVRLRERTISPCMGCAQLWADDNLCKLNGGLTEIFPKILEAEVLILGGPCYFDGRMPWWYLYWRGVGACVTCASLSKENPFL